MRVEIDVSQLQRKLRGLSDKNIRFANANAVNATAKRVQVEARKRLDEIFTLRSGTRQFMERQAAIIKPFAKPSSRVPFAEIAVGQGKRLLLPEFERGAQRRPFTPGAKSMAVPLTGSAARPTKASHVPKALLIKSLRLKPRLTKGQRRTLRAATRGLKGRQRSKFIAANMAVLGIDVSKAAIIGRERTYVVSGVGIFQRVGARNTKLIYAFDRDIRLPANLGFLAAAMRKGEAWLAQEMSAALANEIKLNEARAQRGA